MSRIHIGLVYDLLGSRSPGPDAPPDADAEFEPLETVEVLEAAIRELGHEPVRLGSPGDLLQAGGRGQLPRVEAALNIAEGWVTRNREAWAPVLLEMLGIPALGSDALTLSLSLDKAWTKDVAAAAGIPTPAHVCARSPGEAEGLALPGEFPLFVKPRWEGTAKGIAASSRVENRPALVAEVERVCRIYGQPALIEVFLDGPEYTVTVVGNEPPRPLPVLQRALDPRTRIGLHALASAGVGGAAAVDADHSVEPASEPEPCLPGGLEPELEKRLAELAVASFRALECRDFARADFRLDRRGEPAFLEINPLPTFAPDGSFGILAELAGRPLEALLAEVLQDGLRRLGLPERSGTRARKEDE